MVEVSGAGGATPGVEHLMSVTLMAFKGPMILRDGP